MIHLDKLICKACRCCPGLYNSSSSFQSRSSSPVKAVPRDCCRFSSFAVGHLNSKSSQTSHETSCIYCHTDPHLYRYHHWNGDTRAYVLLQHPFPLVSQLESNWTARASTALLQRPLLPRRQNLVERYRRCFRVEHLRRILRDLHLQRSIYIRPLLARDGRIESKPLSRIHICHLLRRLPNCQLVQNFLPRPHPFGTCCGGLHVDWNVFRGMGFLFLDFLFVTLRCSWFFLEVRTGSEGRREWRYGRRE